MEIRRYGKRRFSGKKTMFKDKVVFLGGGEICLNSDEIEQLENLEGSEIMDSFDLPFSFFNGGT